MIIYFCGLFASLFGAWIGQKIWVRNPHVKKFIVLFLSGFPLFVIAAIRYGVGQDYYYTYVPYFLRLQSDLSVKLLEPIYHLINLFVIWIGGDYQWVFVICSFIFITFLYDEIFNESPYPLLSIFFVVCMSYYFIFLNAMRQLTGCAILLFSLRYVFKKQIWRFIFFVLIASGFHKICILFIPIYWIEYVRIKPGWLFIIMTLLVLIKNLLIQLLNLIISATSYSIYISSQFDTGEQGYIILSISIAILTFSYLFKDDSTKYNIYLNMQFIATLLAILSGEVVLVERIRWIFGFPSIILVPLALKNIKDYRFRSITIVGIVLLFFIYVTIIIGIKNSNNVLPYRTIFNK